MEVTQFSCLRGKVNNRTSVTSSVRAYRTEDGGDDENENKSHRTFRALCSRALLPLARPSASSRDRTQTLTLFFDSIGFRPHRLASMYV